MTPELLTQADQVLSRCGKLEVPRSGSWIDIPVGLHYSKFLAAGAADTTEEKVVDTRVPFIFRSFQAWLNPISVGAVYWRLRLPNGKWYNSKVCAATESFDYGSYRSTIDPPLECPAGSRFYFTTDNIIAALNSDVTIDVLLEGSLRYFLKDGTGCADPIAKQWEAELAKFGRFPWNPNGNILAPEWMLGNQCYPETPAGFKDYAFWYTLPSSIAVNVPIDGSVVSNQPLRIETSADFVMRSLSFIQTNPAGVTGTLYWQIRDDTGYSLTDGFCSANRMSTVVFPEHKIRAGGALFFDYTMQLTSGVGGSTIPIQPVLGGVKRRRA